jgi:predicted HTH transcriptional regulator
MAEDSPTRTAVAFSNADGGVMLIGVEDDGAVLGRAADAGTQDDIHRATQAARDVGRYAIHQLNVDGKPSIRFPRRLRSVGCRCASVLATALMRVGRAHSVVRARLSTPAPGDR